MHHTTSFFRFVREVCHQIAPARVQDALGQRAMHHARDSQVLQGDDIVPVDQPACGLAQIVFAAVADVFVLAVQSSHRLAAVFAALCAPRDPTLRDP